MRPPDAIAILAEDKSLLCPCGAVAERPWSLCRKCSARYAWRRKVASKNRRTSRRLAKRQGRESVQLIARRVTKGVDQ